MFDPLETDSQLLDFGAHIFPDDWEPGSDRLGEVLGPVATDADRIRERYAAAGLDGAVLSQPVMMGTADVDAAAAANDDLRETVVGDGSFYGLAAIPTAAGAEAAAAEFERALEAGLHGGALETRSEGIELVDPTLEPVFEVAESHDAPILVHPTIHASLHEDVDVLSEYKANAIFGREAALADSLSKVIHGGTLDAYPELNLVFHHLGGNIASMLGRVQSYLEPGRWPGEDDVLPYWEFERTLAERIFLDTAGFGGHRVPVRAACEELPASQLLFGTDLPFEPRSAEELRRYAESVATVAGRDAGAVMGVNALELLANV